MKLPKSKANYVIQISSYPPRECGIATFTRDISDAFDHKFNPAVKSKVVALKTDPTSIHNYSDRVINEIDVSNIGNYVNLAKEINSRDDIKIVNIQHEFGLFGGSWGDYIIPFLQVLEKPIVTTFHSVLENVQENDKDDVDNVIRAIANKSSALVVMNELSRAVLESKYQIPRSKIHLIYHGIPQVSFEPSDRFKEELGLAGKTVLTTFGFLSSNKGIQYAIRALPDVIKEYPNIIYMVVGATHPNIVRNDGEVYRNFLISEVTRLGLEDHVKFYNKYLHLNELVNYLRAADIYISPTVDAGQSVSGTISYALGCGRPVVSTATSYAKHIINERVGAIVPVKNSQAITKKLLEFLGDEKRLKSMSIEAYEQTRPMTWPNVAASYFNLYKQFADLEAEEDKLPEIKLDHLIRLTDNFGVFHFAKYSKPEKRYGYSLDDNARALIVAAKYYQKNPRAEVLKLVKTYLSFIKFAERPTGSFANVISYHHKKDGTTDEDVLGRAIWSLGFASSRTYLPEDIRKKADAMFHRALNQLANIKSPRAMAFTLAGIYYNLQAHRHRHLLKAVRELANRQLELYQTNSGEDWHWFEDQLTYSNSKLPESLLLACDLTKNPKYLEVAKKTLDFLKQITFEKDQYVPIGQNGWYFKNKRRAYFDQQPEETATAVETLIIAHKVTGDKQYLKDAYRVFSWFLGKNHLNQMVYDEATGGCYDGVGQYAINLNQGAESTISYLLARLALEEIKTT